MEEKEIHVISDSEANAMAIFLDRMMKSDGFDPDYIIGISRGAYHLVAKINSMTLKWTRIGFLDLDVDKNYPDKKMIKKSLFADDEDLKGVKILLCEDDLRSGSSFIAAKKYFEDNGAIVRTMSFFSHPFSKMTPDYVFQKNVDHEVSFSWDDLKKYARSKSL